MRGDLFLCTGIKSTFPFGDLYLDATSYAPPFRRYFAGDRAGDLVVHERMGNTQLECVARLPEPFIVEPS